MFFSHLSILEPLPSTIRHDRPLLEIDSNTRFEALREIWENLGKFEKSQISGKPGYFLENHRTR